MTSASRLRGSVVLVGALGFTGGGASAQTLDRSRPPVPGPAQPPRFPEIHRRTLSNGITVAIVEDHEIPTVQVRAVTTISTLLDPPGRSGVAELTAAMLSEGTTTSTADQLAERAADIGTPVSPLFFHTVKPNFDRALALMAEQLLRPAFPQAALDRVRGTRVAALRRSKSNPNYLAGRIFANAAYGTGHPYERTISEESLAGITREDVLAFYADYYRPQNLSFVVGGDISASEAVAKLEAVFGQWPAGGKRGIPEVAPPRGPDSTRILLYDIPGSAQTLMFLAQLGPSRDTPDFFPLRLMNAALGGGSSARLSANLRQTRGFTYSVSSTLQYRRRPQIGAFSAIAQVQTSKTDTAVSEIVRELRDIREARPLTEAELNFVRTSQVRALAREFETITQKVNAVVTLLNDELPLDYYATIADQLNSVTLEQVRSAAARHLQPARTVIVLVGDRKLIEEPVRRLGIAPVTVVDENARALP